MPKARIMIVEDEILIAEHIKTNLERIDYSVTSIESTGEDAVENASIQKPDLVIMDISLKGELDGITAADFIQKRFNIPHIYLTSHSDKKMIERAKITEPFGYLIKPLNERELSTAIDIALYKHKAEAKIKQAEEERRIAHDFLKNIINGVTESIIVIDNNFNVILKNHAAEKYLANPGSTKCYEILHGRNSPCMGVKHPCPLEMVQKTHQPATLVHEHLGPDGNPVYMEILASPLKGAAGEMNGIIESMRDVTRRKKYEMKILEYSQKLEESNSLKNLYADILHHDLINPLSAIGMAVGLLKEGYDFPNNMQKYISMIEMKTKEMTDLIQIAQRYTFLEDKSEIEFQERDILTILHSSINELKFFAQNEKTIITMETSGEFVLPCNELLKEVFTNLLSNAIKYSPQGTEVKTGIVAEDSNYRIYFKDRGEGIPDKFKKKIFNRFTRKAKEGVKGSGLGLAIVQKTLELHNGKIWVEDNPEGGSIFFVSLPKNR